MDSLVFEQDDYPAFRSHPMVRGGHLQTLSMQFLPKPSDPDVGVCHIVEMSDGDQIAVIEDEFKGWETGNRIVVVMHGLTGSHQSQYVIRLRNQLESLPFKMFRIDMRGFGDSTFLSRGHSNAGSDHDLRDVINWIVDEYPESPITVVGFSLGGNITLNYLGRDPSSLPAQLDSSLLVAPPIDLMHCAWNLRTGLNRIYDRAFVATLHRQLRLRRRRIEGLLDLPLVPLPTRLLQFDDQYTAPICGYSGAREYYQQCSSAPRLKRIRVPCRILVAEDDPVVPVSMFTNWPVSDSVQLFKTRSGGHLGYVGPSMNRNTRWLDQRLADWVRQLGQANVSGQIEATNRNQVDWQEDERSTA